MKSFKVGLMVFGVLVVSAGVMLWKLATSKEPVVERPRIIEPAKSRIVATRELQAFTFLKDSDLESRSASASGQTTPNLDKLTNRYLLVSVRQGAEVKEEMVAPQEATPLLDDAVAVGIPASATTSLGGQLRVGDLVDLIAVPSKENTRISKFEKLMVLNTLQGNKEANSPNAITLAVPYSQRDDFASAVVGAELLVTRKVFVAK